MTHMLLSSVIHGLVYLLIYKIARPFGIPATIVFVIGGIAASVPSRLAIRDPFTRPGSLGAPRNGAEPTPGLFVSGWPRGIPMDRALLLESKGTSTMRTASILAAAVLAALAMPYAGTAQAAPPQTTGASGNIAFCKATDPVTNASVPCAPNAGGGAQATGANSIAIGTATASGDGSASVRRLSARIRWQPAAARPLAR